MRVQCGGGVWRCWRDQLQRGRNCCYGGTSWSWWTAASSQKRGGAQRVCAEGGRGSPQFYLRAWWVLERWGYWFSVWTWLCTNNVPPSPLFPSTMAAGENRWSLEPGAWQPPCGTSDLISTLKPPDQSQSLFMRTHLLPTVVWWGRANYLCVGYPDMSWFNS